MTTTPLTDGQLAAIKARHAYYLARRSSRPCPAHPSADDVPALLAELDRMAAELADVREHLDALALVKVWRNEDGREFLFADDVRAVVGTPANPAAAVPSA